jgi:hypothetical protein
MPESRVTELTMDGTHDDKKKKQRKKHDSHMYENGAFFVSFVCCVFCFVSVIHEFAIVLIFSILAMVI